MKKFFIAFFFVIVSFSQNNEETLVSDTIYNDYIHLKEIVLYPKLKFGNYNDMRSYYILRRKVLKMYPYAYMASDYLIELNTTLNTLEKGRHKRKYIKKLQSYIEDEFKEELKKCTRTEGQILVKLIYRQTGISMFELIKTYKSGFKAFVYNSAAGMFNISLKQDFNPKSILEDFYIEDIIQRAQQELLIDYQKPFKEYDYYDLKDHWNKL